MENIDVKALKSQLTFSDYTTILEKLNIPLRLKTDKYWLYYSGDKYLDCLLHKPKLYFYLSNKIFVNYSKAVSYDIIGLIQARLAILNRPSNFTDAISFILSTLNVDTNFVTKSNKIYKCNWEEKLEKFVRFKTKYQSLKILNDNILNYFPQILPFQWLLENISIESMLKYKIGFYERLQCTTIPVWDEFGNLIGIRCRHWKPEEIDTGKYKPVSLLNNITYKFPTNECFYGINYNQTEIKRTKTVILVEGEKSVLRADTLWNEKSNVLGLFGSQIGNCRKNMLIKMGVEHIILALDSDFHVVGDDDYYKFERKIKNLASLFKDYATVDVVYNNIGLNNAYKCSPFDFEDNIVTQLFDKKERI